MKELPNPTFPLSPLSLPRGLLQRVHARRHEVAVPAAAPLTERAGLVVSWARHEDIAVVRFTASTTPAWSDMSTAT
ncbi:MAG: hypothetical protein Q7K57_58670 [Burkholderiaceae bacterium]|nr:hypothetical protein [Burkholderiaceae bacterium]